MKIISNLEEFKPTGDPISLTIGKFDGVHRGHLAVLAALTGQKVVFTFSNHPVEVLGDAPLYRITTHLHRLRLLEEAGVETSVLIPFTRAFSNQSAEAFLTTLKKQIPFSRLVLGYDAQIGKDRIKDLSSLSRQLGFSLEHLPPLTSNDGSVISSSKLRGYIQSGELERVRELLGRPYSIYSTVEWGAGKGRALGFRTANLSLHDLSLPPFGVYVIEAKINGSTHFGIANLGKAPTIHTDRSPLLEVHLFDFDKNIYHQSAEIIFKCYLRAEEQFESITDLKTQIKKDIEDGKKICGLAQK